jgi:hypothetical protein
VSALPATTISAPESHSTGIKGKFIRTRAADLSVYSHMTQSEIGCVTLINVESIGWGKKWTRRSLKMADFAQHCNQEERTCQNALTKLEADGLIERTKTGRGYEYERVQRIDYDGPEAIGNCPSCKKPTQFTLDRDVPIPHSLFLNVQQAVDRGTFLCVLLIALETMRWNPGKDGRAGEIWIHPAEIKVEEFCRRTGLNKSEVEADLNKAEAQGFIGSSGRRGSVQTYWAIPNTWPQAGVKPKKIGGNPKPGRRKESEQEIHSVPQPTQNTAKASPVEFWCKPCGTCHECRYFGPVEIVPTPENPVRKPLGRARDGPLPDLRAPGKPWQAPWKTKEA